MIPDTSISRVKNHEESLPLGRCLAHWAREYGNRVALVDQCGERLSYSELRERVECLAGGLYAAGLRPGEHVIVQMPNTFGFFFVFFALLRLGVVPVMAMPNQRERDIDALMRLARPVAYFIPDDSGEHALFSLAEKMLSKHESLRLVVMDGKPEMDKRDVLILDDLRGLECPWPKQDARDMALLLLSGGTTNTPKLIPRTHGDYFYNFAASAKLCGFNADTVFLAALPAAHNFTLASPGVLGAFQCGGTVVTPVSAGCDEAMPLIEKERVTHVALVPPLAKLWVEGRKWEDSDLSSLKVAQVGGSRLESKLAKQLIDALGCQLQQVFGMAEGLLCYTRLDDSLQTIIHTQGRPLSLDDEVRIVDDEGRDVAEGQLGELLTRGPYTIRGYFRAPAQNKASFTEDGFYRSGDLVRRDENGNLIVEGRVKEQINRCGEKISAVEVEEALSAIHGVYAAMVVGVPDELLGERICAFIKSEGREIDPVQLKTALRAHGLSDYKVPDQIETIAEWPLTAARKIDKRHLIDIATQRTSGAPASMPSRYRQEVVPITSASFDLAVKLANHIHSEASGYVLYERHGEYSLGVDCAMEITVDADGTVRRGDGKFWRLASTGEGVERALADIPFEDWRAYGRVDFEFAYLTYDMENTRHSGPLLRIVIPRCEIRVRRGSARLRALSAEDMIRLKDAVDAADKSHTPRCDAPVGMDVGLTGGPRYRQLVASAMKDIRDSLYKKVILSRHVPCGTAVQYTGTLLPVEGW